MRTTVEGNIRMGEIFAEKLNSAIGPVVVMIPIGGFSEVDCPGQRFRCPEADQAFVDSLRKYLRLDILSKLARSRSTIRIVQAAMLNGFRIDHSKA